MPGSSDATWNSALRNAGDASVSRSRSPIWVKSSAEPGGPPSSERSSIAALSAVGSVGALARLEGPSLSVFGPKEVSLVPLPSDGEPAASHAALSAGVRNSGAPKVSRMRPEPSEPIQI